MSERGSSAKSIKVDNGKSSGQRQALYRKYRPETLDEVIGQPQVTDILKAIAKSRKFAHAYLFTGQRGTGKTSIARILAHLINKTPYNSSDIDIIEIDAASRGSVDDARELREKSAIAPVSADHKIYIIDEVHMLSNAAFNALLKLIEEPPEHIIFILATTEIQKVPATILSRVQRFHLRPVNAEVVATHLANIAKAEAIAIDKEALLLIAERGGGSFRDSIGLLDQLSGSNVEITRQTVEEILGLAPETAIQNLISALTAHDLKTLIFNLDELSKDGVNASLIAGQLITELGKLAPEKPRFYDLIEKLLEVTKSSAPSIKLTAILANATIKSSINTVATTVTPPKANQKLATIIEREIRQEIESNRKKIPGEETSNPTEKIVTKNEESDSNSTDDKLAKVDSVTATGETPAEIVWDDALDQLKKMDQPAILATLKFADIEYEDGKLTLFFERAFHRKKAGTPKMREVLAKCLIELYNSAPNIVIASSARSAIDSKDSLVAGVAAIMGGGEIVKEI